MNKETWIEKAADYLEAVEIEGWDREFCMWYAEELYDPSDSPESAVDMDMSYWGD